MRTGDHLVCGTELALPQMHAIGQVDTPDHQLPNSL